jgi:hypothetical protein
METAEVWKREGNKLGCEIDVMVPKEHDSMVTWLIYPKCMLDMPDGGWKVEKVDIRLRFLESRIEDGRLKFVIPRFMLGTNCKL